MWAEAVIDVIKAKTDKAQEVAQSHLSGSLANKIKELRNNVTEVLAHLEVAIDFSEEDVEEITYQTLSEKAEELFNMLSKKFVVSYDESGSIGKRYRRADAIGTPFAITIDDETLNKYNNSNNDFAKTIKNNITYGNQKS